MAQTSVGIIGGSGFYQFADGREVLVNTPYGKPSDKILLTRLFGQRVAFLPRHGRKHQFPPHKINYRANLFALKKLGCERIIAPAAVGSLNSKMKPGDFVICDQFIDRTKNRRDTFFEGKTTPLFARIGGIDLRHVTHISCAAPYCPELRKLAIAICQKLKIKVHKKGTAVVIEGPRFSSGAESKFYARTGGDVINMTQYPEVVLARELELCYVNISLVTDYDVGFKNRDDIRAVTAAEVAKVFRQNNERVRIVILEMIKKLPKVRSCECARALESAKI